MKKRTVLSLVLALVLALSSVACITAGTKIEGDDGFFVSFEPANTEAQVEEAIAEAEAQELALVTVASEVEVGDPTASKTIVVTVQYDGLTSKYTIHTDAANLQDALLGVEGLVSGSDSDYGLFITKVEERTADDANQEWWCITKGGETLFTGAKDTVIADGEAYELTLTVGW